MLPCNTSIAKKRIVLRSGAIYYENVPYSADMCGEMYLILERFRVNSLLFRGSTALVGLGLLIVQVPRTHSHTHAVGLLWTSDQPDAEIYT
jgi:hypothetical protein